MAISYSWLTLVCLKRTHILLVYFFLLPTTTFCALLLFFSVGSDKIDFKGRNQPRKGNKYIWRRLIESKETGCRGKNSWRGGWVYVCVLWFLLLINFKKSEQYSLFGVNFTTFINLVKLNVLNIHIFCCLYYNVLPLWGYKRMKMPQQAGSLL